MGRPTQEKQHLIDKYKELTWALAFQGYDEVEIGVIMNRDKSVIHRIKKEMPKKWEPKWVKVQ